MTVQILIGDCREKLKELPDESVHCCVTSPPYFGLRDYGHADQIGLEPTPDEFVAAMVDVFREVRRVLRSDGTLWLNLGDSYATQGGRGEARMEELGRPTLGAKTVAAARGAASGTKMPVGLKPKDLIGIPWRVAFALQADGWWLRSSIIWHKPNPMPESVTDRPTSAHENLFLLAKSDRYFYDASAVRETSVTNDPRRPYTSEGAKQMDGRSEWRSGERRDGEDFTTRNLRNVWTVATQPFSEAHFATFPPDLIEPCVKAGCPAGGTVLDPFGGAGTTGVVANLLKRDCILIELNPEYAKMARRRIKLPFERAKPLDNKRAGLWSR